MAADFLSAAAASPPPSTVYTFRPFCNSDPPRLAEIWRDQPPQRGLMQPVSAAVLEQLVFAKPYFDPEGLIIAFAENEPVGFIHAGFGAGDEQTALDTDTGTTYLLMLRARHRDAVLADELLIRAENYLRGRGAKVIYAGGIRPQNAFYLGLYGRSELPGILVSDPVAHDACRRGGYREIDRVHVLQLELASYRPAFSRVQRQLSREVSIIEVASPATASWWEACTTCAFERIHFSLAPAGGGERLASVGFWDIEPLSTAWGAPTAGMLDLEVSAQRRRQGIATFLLSEAFARLRTRGVMRVEAQTMQQNAPAIALYEKLGFAKVDEGIVYRKE
jgi:ribosomal protein S18 acetylase RimI-like enzyme